MRRTAATPTKIEIPASSAPAFGWGRGSFGPVVQPLVLAMLDLRHDLAPCGAVGAELVGYDTLWRTTLLPQKLVSNRRADFVFLWTCTSSSRT